MFNAKTLAAVLAATSLVAAAPSYYSAPHSDPGCDSPPAAPVYPKYHHKYYNSTSPGNSDGGYPSGPISTSTPTPPSTGSGGYPSAPISSGTPPSQSLPSNGGYPTNDYPTNSYPSGPSPVAPVNSAVITHRVTAGFNGLTFEPHNIVANVGEVVEFKFLPANHSVAQSSFDEPCKPLTDDSGNQVGFFAGFDFVTANGQLAPDVFQIEIKDTKPIWFYCPQTKGSHCKAGMSGVINQDYSSNVKTLAKYQEAAALTDTVVPNTIQGGQEFLNPNPNAGFP